MLEIKIGKSQTQKTNKKIENAIKRFINLKNQEKSIKQKLKNIQTLLAKFGEIELNEKDNASINLIVDDNRLNIKYDWDIKVKDNKKLHDILGNRYKDLVNIRTQIKPLTKLKEMALDNDNLKLCLDIKQKSPVFKVM